MILITISVESPAHPGEKVESTFTDSAWVEQSHLADNTIGDLVARLEDRTHGHLAEKANDRMIGGCS